MSTKPALIPIATKEHAAGDSTPAPDCAPRIYKDLIKHQFAAMRSEDKEGEAEPSLLALIEQNPATPINQTERNFLTALSGWMTNKKLTDQSIIGREFGDDFEEELRKHHEYLRTKNHQRGKETVRGLSQSTIRNRNSLLLRWHQSWQELLRTAALPQSLPEALQHLLNQHHMSIVALAREVDLKDYRLRQWVNGNSNPSAENMSGLRRIEEYFSLTEGSLTTLVKGTRRLNHGAPTTEFGKRMRTACDQNYLLHQFPARVEAEWNELYNLMTPELTPDGPLRRNKSWYVDDVTGQCSAGRRFREMFESFFGYLCLPLEGRQFPIKRKQGKKLEVVGHTTLKGKGLAPEDLTLALVIKFPLVKSYLEFKKGRAGCYNDDTSYILRTCRQLLRRGTGFVRQHPDFGERLSPPVTASEWDTLCDAAHKRYSDLAEELDEKNLIQASRPAEEPIQWILDRKHPVHVLIELALRMEANLPAKCSPIHRALAYRDLLLVRFLTANPLRIKHFVWMEWRADDSGNLFQQEDGSWWVRFPKRFFKNRKYLEKDKKKWYFAETPPSLWPYIETYLTKYRPLLEGADTCDLVFRPGASGKSGKADEHCNRRMTSNRLGGVLRAVTRIYLKHAGFGPQAYRHIVATEYIKNNLNGFEVAASALNDKPATVRKRYAHLEHADYFRHWLQYHEDQQELVLRLMVDKERGRR